MSIFAKIRTSFEADLQVCGDGGYEASCQAGHDAALLTASSGVVYLGNAFSLQMVGENAIIIKEAVEASDVPRGAVSIIGHPDTATVVGSLLGREVHCNRVSITLRTGDVLYVAQVVGGRLPEGSTTLPEGVTLRFYRVYVTEL